MAEEPKSNKKRTLIISTESSNKKIRSRKACIRCHQRKTKCTGEIPACKQCMQNKAGDKCVYLVVERPKEITIKESYLIELNEKIASLQSQLENQTRKVERFQMLFDQSNSILLSNKPGQSNVKSQDETFQLESKSVIHSLPTQIQLNDSVNLEIRQHLIDSELVNPMLLDEEVNLIGKINTSEYLGYTSSSKFNLKLQEYILQYTGGDLSVISKPSDIYYDSENLHWNTNINYKLPSKDYAIKLSNVAFQFLGCDYYLALIQAFYKLIDSIYSPNPLSNFPSKIEMCLFFVLISIGELYVSSISKMTPNSNSVPGIKFFVYATNLLSDDFEKPSIKYIETLLLLAFYSHALNRQNSSYAYSGIALRLSFSLGLHRDPTVLGITDPVEAERRRRVFWSCYLNDRLGATKLGRPLMINDEEIDVRYPSMECLDSIQQQQFVCPKTFVAQIKSAQVASLIVKTIYGRPSKFNPSIKCEFVKNIQHVLKELRHWQNNLDPELKLNFYNIEKFRNSRSIYSLSMNYNEYIILTTRPLFLFVFKKIINDASWKPPPTLLAIAETCVQAALSNNTILNILWREGTIARYGYFDAHFIFSSTTILIIALLVTDYSNIYIGQNSNLSTADTSTTFADAQVFRIDCAINLLKTLKDGGSIGASDFYLQLLQLKEIVKKVEVANENKFFKNKYLSEQTHNKSYNGSHTEYSTIKSNNTRDSESSLSPPNIPGTFYTNIEEEYNSLKNSEGVSSHLSEDLPKSILNTFDFQFQPDSELIFDDKVIQEFLDNPITEEQWANINADVFTPSDFLDPTDFLNSFM